MTLTVTIPGRQLTKKRHYRNKRGGGFYLSQDFKIYEKAALTWLMQWGNVWIPGRVIVCAHYYPPDKRGHPDIDNLYATWGDILQKAGLIENDKFIKWGDSDIMEPDRDNPRVELVITSRE